MSTSPPLVVADRYRLVAPLGQGGMGRVWRATDVVLHREVAIKELVPPPGLTPDERKEMRERSLREARAIARLNNINVVRVFDVLRTDADPWIVMEYVPSRSLQDILAADGPFAPVRAAEIGLGVLNALRAAHRAGVVHRDVKPGNVLIGEDGRVVLTDFGLATVPGDPNVTRTGLVLGSPAYIAPERARDGTAGPGADLWSLGATLYAAVEGASPFARPSAIATLAALATENPPPARNAGPLKPVLNGLLRKDPAHRINADEAERLLLRATGKRSKLSFPMSPTMRRPGVGRERPSLGLTPPVVPGVSASAPVVPGPRPPVTPARPPVTPGRAAGPPVTPGRAPVSPAGPPVNPGRPPIFAPGKASVGRAPAETPKPPALDATRIDPNPSSTGTAKPPPPPATSTSRGPATDATMRGSGSAPGSFTADQVAAARKRPIGRSTPPTTPPQARPATPEPPPPTAQAASTGSTVADRPTAAPAAPGSAEPATPDAPATREDANTPPTGAGASIASPPKPDSPPSDTRPDELAADIGAESSRADELAADTGTESSRGDELARTAADLDAESESSGVDEQVTAAAESKKAELKLSGVDEQATTDSKAKPDKSDPSSIPVEEAKATTIDSENEPDKADSSTGPTGEARAASADSQAEPDESDSSAALRGETTATSAAPQAEPDKSDSSAGLAGEAGAASADSQAEPDISDSSASLAGDVKAAGANSHAEPDKYDSSSATVGESKTTSTSSQVQPDKSDSSGVSAEEASAPTADAGTEPDKSDSSDVLAGVTTATSAAPQAEPDKSDSSAPAGEAKAAAPAGEAKAAALGEQAQEGQDAPQASASARAATKASRKKNRGRTAKTPPGTPASETDHTPDETEAPDQDAALTAGAAALAAEATTHPASDTDQHEPGPDQDDAPSQPDSRDGQPADRDDQAEGHDGPAGDKDGQAEDRAGGPDRTRIVKPATGPDDPTKPRSGTPKRPHKTAADRKAGLAATRVGAIPAARAEASPAPVSGAPISGAPGSGFGQPNRPAWQPMTVRAPSTGGRGITIFGTTLTRRQTLIAVGVLVAVLLALVVLIPQAFGGDKKEQGTDNGRKAGVAPAASATKPTTAPTSAAAAPAPTTAQPSSAPPSSAAPPAPGDVTIPKGWYRYSDGSGFSVPVPNGVSIEHRGSEVYFRKDNRLLIIDQTDQPQPDPVADWKAQEADRRGRVYRDYERIKIEPVDYFVKAADWEFTYTTSSGNPQRAVKRGVITESGKQAYGISWYTSPDDWQDGLKDLQLIYQGFKPKS